MFSTVNLIFLFYLSLNQPALASQWCSTRMTVDEAVIVSSCEVVLRGLILKSKGQHLHKSAQFGVN